MKQKIWSFIKITLIWLVIIVGVLEIFLRIANPFKFTVEGNKIKLNTNYTETYHHKFQLIPADPVKTFNDFGFQGPNLTGDTKPKIFTIGGSTTNCDLVTTSKSWPALLYQCIDTTKVTVNNAGFSGHTSFGHQILLDDIILPLHPKEVLIMCGANDRGLADITVKDQYQMKEDASLYNWKGKMSYYFFKYSRVASTIQNFARAAKARGRVSFYAGQFDPKSPEYTTPLDSASADKVLNYHRSKFLKGYERRLNTLIETCQKNNVKACFITQPIVFGTALDSVYNVDLNRFKVPVDLGDIGFERDNIDSKTEYLVLELYNDVMRKVAQEKKIPLIDLSRLMPKSFKYFYDPIHFTEEGCQEVARIVCNSKVISE